MAVACRDESRSPPVVARSRSCSPPGFGERRVLRCSGQGRLFCARTSAPAHLSPCARVTSPVSSSKGEDVPPVEDSVNSRAARAARNQSLFRAVNERLEGLAETFQFVSEVSHFACECADLNCFALMDLTLDEY